jgi:hypothetical protein
MRIIRSRPGAALEPFVECFWWTVRETPEDSDSMDRNALAGNPQPRAVAAHFRQNGLSFLVEFP